MSGAYRLRRAPYARALADAGADAPRREARNIVLNMRAASNMRMLRQGAPRRGLNELGPLSNPSGRSVPEDLSRGAMKALDAKISGNRARSQPSSNP